MCIMGYPLFLLTLAHCSSRIFIILLLSQFEKYVIRNILQYSISLKLKEKRNKINRYYFVQQAEWACVICGICMRCLTVHIEITMTSLPFHTNNLTIVHWILFIDCKIAITNTINFIFSTLFLLLSQSMFLQERAADTIIRAIVFWGIHNTHKQTHAV